MTVLRTGRIDRFRAAAALSALFEVASSASSGIAAQALAGRTGGPRVLRKRLADPPAMPPSTRFGPFPSAGLAELAAREAGAS